MVRPRPTPDVLVLTAASLLGAVAIVIWMGTASASDQARASGVGGVVTTFGTIVGYYLGNRGAEAASEEARVEHSRASRLEAEVAETRAFVARLEAQLDEAIEDLNPQEKTHKDAENGS